MKKSIITLVIIVLLIGALLTADLIGFGSVIPAVKDGVVLGLDLVGGCEITYEAVVPEGTSEDALADGMESAKTMLQQRLDALGYTEGNAYISNDKQVVVEIPAVEDPQQAVKDLGATAIVTFTDADGKVWLSGTDIKDASFEYSPTDYTGVAKNHVKLELTSEGQTRLFDASSAILQRSDGKTYLAIMLDDNEISTPGISQELNTSEVIIDLGTAATAEEAKYLADIISAGKLPFELTTAKVQSVGASLGERSLSTSLFAGLAGMILVMLFMIVVYRLMGAISCIALAAYAALFGFCLSIFRINLSLPGIAGIILTIGMAVDANVIIFERIKEEIQLGKTLRYAVDSGFKRAFWAIFDANITTMIAGGVLLWQGSGTILGFAKTLLIGVVLSMTVMLVLTRLLLKTAVGLKITNLKLYCVGGEQNA